MAVDMLAIVVGLSLTLYLIFTATRNLMHPKQRERGRDFVDALVLGLGSFYLIKIIVRDLIPYFAETVRTLETGIGFG